MRRIHQNPSPHPVSAGQGRALEQLVPALLGWFQEHARVLPWRQTRDPYAIWVSEIMLQQTQVKTVLPYYERWMSTLPDVAALAHADPQRIHKLWEGLGYYTRVRNMQKAAQQILRDHNGQFPSRFEAIWDLPGIGRYTAGAIASIAFGQPVAILDGNVARILARIFAIAGDPKDKAVNARLWELAQALVERAAHPSGKHRRSACGDLNESLMELGALVCTPRDPACAHCPAAQWCRALQQNRVGELPTPVTRTAATARRFFAFVVTRKNKYLVRQRAPDTVNGHLWEFPNVEVRNEKPEAAAEGLFGSDDFELDELMTIRHTITRYRITLQAYRMLGRAPRPVTPAGYRWVTAAQLDQLPFPSAHRKIVRALLR